MGVKLTPALMKTARKALVAGVTALTGSVITALADGDLSTVEIIAAALTGLVAVVGVYQVPNEPGIGE